MISIHLRRTGASKDAHYRVVVSDSRAARDGAFIEVLGHYHPRFDPAKVVIDMEKTNAWIAKGAQPSDTVRSLLRKVAAGAVETEQAVAPSRHRDAAKHAQIRATAPAPEPQPEVQEATPEEATEEAGEEAAAAAESEDAPQEEAPAAAAADASGDEAEQDKE